MVTLCFQSLQAVTTYVSRVNALMLSGIAPAILHPGSPRVLRNEAPGRTTRGTKKDGCSKYGTSQFSLDMLRELAWAHGGSNNSRRLQVENLKLCATHASWVIAVVPTGGV